MKKTFVLFIAVILLLCSCSARAPMDGYNNAAYYGFQKEAKAELPAGSPAEQNSGFKERGFYRKRLRQNGRKRDIDVFGGR